jgi:hypothetical protein
MLNLIIAITIYLYLSKILQQYTSTHLLDEEFKKRLLLCDEIMCI